MMQRTVPHRRGLIAAVSVMILAAAACGSGSPGSLAPIPRGSLARPAGNGTIAFARLDRDEAREGLAPLAQLVELEEDGGVRRVGAAVSFRSTPAWSPDGRVLAYVGRSGLESIDWRVHRVLVSCRPSSCTGIGPPTWSPDGTLVAFAAELEGRFGLWTVGAEGGEPSLLVGGLEIVGAPSFAPDGARVAVVVDRGGSRGIVMVDVATGESLDRIEPGGLILGETVAWSPDGATLAVGAEAAGGGGIYLMRPDGSGVRLLTSCPDDACVDLGPAWSPDGSTIAFTRGRCDEAGSDCFVGDLFTIPATGGGAQALTAGPSLDCCAAWQPVA